MESGSERKSDEDHLSVTALAAGLGCLVGPALRKCSTSVETAKKSQQSLEAHVMKLTSELDKMLEDAPLPMLSQHAARLAAVHKRVISLTASLQLIQGRIVSINTLLDTHERAEVETSGTSSTIAAAQFLSDRWTFLRTTTVQDSGISKAVSDKPIVAVTQEALSELLMHLQVFNVD